MVADYVGLKQANCKDCYRCIRNCPVQAISYTDHQARILDEDCVVCGRCFVACPQNAKEIRDDVPKARKLLAGGAPVWASLAPSFVARYENIGLAGVRDALKKLGFAGVQETALGAAVVKKRYDEMIMAEEQDIIISSCCHSVTMLLQKHFPAALPCLAPVLSPMQAHCQAIKLAEPGAKTVFIGPCISKKAEADAYPGLVDCVLTFEELSAWFKSEGISPESDTSAEDAEEAGKTRLFPATGGILKSMDCANEAYAYLSVDGVENCIQAVKDILAGSLGKCFIEMSICAGSCIGGPAMDLEHRLSLRANMAVNASAGREDFTVVTPPATALVKDMGRGTRTRYVVAENDIRDVLRKTGKTRPEHELNCGSCGYPTCRDKARAVVLGKADLAMCLPYLKEKAESFSDAIITHTPNAILVLDEGLHVQQVNDSARRLFGAMGAADIPGASVSRFMDPDIFLEARDRGATIYDRPAYFADHGKYVEQTVIHDPNFHIFVAIIRDVTEAETARRERDAMRSQTIAVADDVVAKQMRVVQEIASLLGETTAETKIALTRLKGSLNND